MKDTFKIQIVFLLQKDVAQVNELCKTKYLPKVKFSDLKENNDNRVTKIIKVTSTFSDTGKAVELELDEALRAFLPFRTSDTLTANGKLYKNLEDKVAKEELYMNHIRRGEFEFKVTEKKV